MPAQQTQPSRQAQQDASPADSPRSKVLFERHSTADAPAPSKVEAPSEENSSPSSAPAGEAPGAASLPPKAVSEMENVQDGSTRTSIPAKPSATAIAEPQRLAPGIRSIALELHLNQHTGALSAHAVLRVENSGTVPMRVLPLQISSALQWRSASVASTGGADALPLSLEQHPLTTDADHTGAANEVVLTLPEPVVPGGAIKLTVLYDGRLVPSAERLRRLGAPADKASLSDWDITSDAVAATSPLDAPGAFTGIRGFGNVLWYPVVAPPVFLAENAAFRDEVDRQRALGLNAVMALRLIVETKGTPDAAFFNGQRQALVLIDGLPDDHKNVTDEAGATRIFSASWQTAAVGAHLPSLFVLASAAQSSADGLLQVVTDRADTVSAYAAAAARVRPMLEEWLGPRPAAPLQVIDLPFAGGQPFADGTLLVAPLRAVEPKLLAPSLVYPLAAAWLPRDAAPWITAGLPEFLRLLYVERTQGREAALVDLNASGDALTQREAFLSAATPALGRCVDAVCARTKGAYVFTMLRQVVGDAALKQALLGWRAGHGAAPAGTTGEDAVLLRRFLEQTSGKDLGWFFADWVDRDRGLPELTIVSVAPRRVERGSINNTVPTERRPVAGPIGAEPLPQAGDPTRQEHATQASRNRVAPREGSWLIAVEVQNNGDARAEVPVTVRSSSLQNTLPLRIPAHGRATVRVPFETAPEEVWVNDGSTPEVRSVTHHRSIDIPESLR